MRTAKPIDHDRIRELKHRINDRRYLEHAVDRLAQRLTSKLIEHHGEQQNGSRGTQQPEQPE